MSFGKVHPGIKLFVIAAAIAWIVDGLRHFGPVTHPIQEGDPDKFWSHATGIRLADGSFAGTFAVRVYPPRDGYVIYGWARSFLHRVPMADALEMFPRVVQELEDAHRQTTAWEQAVKEAKARRPKDLDVEAQFALDMEAEVDAEKHWRRPDVVRGFARWRERDGDRNDAVGLLECIDGAWVELYKVESPDSVKFYEQNLRDFDERWKRAEFFWRAILFEFVYLSSLIVIAAWPWLRAGRPMMWSIHFGLLPLLVMIPYYLGYAPWTFLGATTTDGPLSGVLVKSSGPNGGVLYSQVIVQFGRVYWWTTLDIAVAEGLPAPLDSLSSTPGPAIRQFSFDSSRRRSAWPGYGPITALAMGLVIGAVAFAVAFLVQNGHRETTQRVPLLSERLVVLVTSAFALLAVAIMWLVERLTPLVAPIEATGSWLRSWLRVKCPWLRTPLPSPWNESDSGGHGGRNPDPARILADSDLS